MSNREDPQGWDTKVTYLGRGKYGCRVLREGKMHTEVVVEGRRGIRAALRGLLRWVDKMGYDSTMADASRHRDGRKAIRDR